MNTMKKCPQSVFNQPDCMEQSKPVNLEHLQDITKEKIEFRPTAGMYTYNTAQVISNYLKPL